MRRVVRLIVLFVVALPVVPFVPLYLERTMLRSFRTGSAGDKIDWGWKLTSLVDYWSNYNHMTRDQRPWLWLQLDIALALLYALLFAIAVDQIFAWRQRRKSSTRSTLTGAQPSRLLDWWDNWTASEDACASIRRLARLLRRCLIF